MALLTWYQFKTETKKLISDATASDDLFASACAAYVKAMISREVDHDLLLSKSYMNYYDEMRRRLLGFTPSLAVGSTLDVAVKILLPVDAQREGIQAYITQQIKNAYQELVGLANFVEKTMREAIIDLQSYVPCYRVGQESIYTTSTVTVTGNMSRGQVPEQGELREAFLLQDVDALAENVAYVPGDFVASNGRTYMVLNSGQLSTGQLGSGLQTTDGSIETLGALTFTFYYGEGCFRSEVISIPWSERFAFNNLRDGPRGNRDTPAMIAIDRESYSFYLWPKLDSTHRLSVFWTGLKFNFADGDNVPFDETAQDAVRHSVLAKYYLQVEKESRAASMHEQQYAVIRARAYTDCRARQQLEYYKP